MCKQSSACARCCPHAGGVPNSQENSLQKPPMLQSRGGRDFAVTLTHPVLPWGPWAAQVREGSGCISNHRRRCCTMRFLGRLNYCEHLLRLPPCLSCARKRGSGTLSTCWLKWGRHVCCASGRMLGVGWSSCLTLQARWQPINWRQGVAAVQGGRLIRMQQDHWLPWLLRGASIFTSVPCFQWLTWTYCSQSWARTAPSSCTCEVRSMLGVRPVATWAMLLPACTLQLSSCRRPPVQLQADASGRRSAIPLAPACGRRLCLSLPLWRQTCRSVDVEPTWQWGGMAPPS